MQTFLLATNLFALAALLLGLNSFYRGRRQQPRLLPLFLLVISRSLLLLSHLAAPEYLPLIGALDVFSVLCIAWALTGPVASLPAPWPPISVVGLVGAVMLALLPLVPGSTIPYPLYSLTVAVFSTPLIFISTPDSDMRWPGLIPPLALAVASFVSLADFVNLSWFISLLGYVFFVHAIHAGRIQADRQAYETRRQEVEAWAQDAIDLTREQQRWLDVSDVIWREGNQSPSPEHIARSLAAATHVEQLALFTLTETYEVQLLALHGSDSKITMPVRFKLDACPPLEAAIQNNQSMLFPQHQRNGLNQLYGLWAERRQGPTLVQPLERQGQTIGAVILGNPVTRHPIRESDIRLCQMLAPRLALSLSEPVSSPTAPALAESNATTADKYLTVLEALSEGVVVSDNTGQVRLANRAAERVLGRSVESLLGQPISTIYGEIDSGEPIEALMVAFSRRDRPLPTYIETNERVIQGRLIPWRNQHKEWLGIIAVFRDVTREVRVDQSRHDFLSAISYGVREPLTIIKGYSELITSGDIEDYSPEQLQVQEIIHRNADRLTSVLEEALNVSTHDRERFLPRFEEIDTKRIVKEAVEAARESTYERHINLIYDVKANVPPIVADRRHIRKVLDQLLSNACRFTPPGGRIDVRVWVQERLGQPPRTEVMFAIRDNGVGMPPSATKRIFDPFYRLNNENPADKAGLGLGLAVVKELVDWHNGRVWVESKLNEGSTFFVMLPVVQDY